MQLDGISSYGYASWLRLPKMLRIYRMLALYQEMRLSFATSSVTTVILRLVPLIAGVTHVYGCVWWYIGTCRQPKTLAELQALDLDESPHAWVFYYSGMGEEHIWSDNVRPQHNSSLLALPKRCFLLVLGQ